MEQFTEQLRTFGGLFLAGFNGDVAKATEALEKSNKILADNPRIIPMLANEDNQKQIGEIITFVESGKGDLFSIIAKVQKLGKKLKI
jgi:hypothetical protein